MKNIERLSKRLLVETIDKEYLADKSCSHCGESETVCLKFYPHNNEIRKLTKRKGMNEESRKDTLNLIKQSHIVCSNCFVKLDNDLIEFI